jgi:sugar/nucleoside kinase (ribokinase family)
MLSVFSPNHLEAAAFFGISEVEVEKSGKKGIEEVARRFVNRGLGKKTLRGGGDVVIRSGHLGAFVISFKGEERWIKPFWEDQSKVKDATGAGALQNIDPFHDPTKIGW